MREPGSRSRFGRRQWRRRLAAAAPYLIGGLVVAALGFVGWVLFYSTWLAVDDVDVDVVFAFEKQRRRNDEVPILKPAVECAAVGGGRRRLVGARRKIQRQRPVRVRQLEARDDPRAHGFTARLRNVHGEEVLQLADAGRAFARQFSGDARFRNGHGAPGHPVDSRPEREGGDHSDDDRERAPHRPSNSAITAAYPRCAPRSRIGRRRSSRPM